MHFIICRGTMMTKYVIMDSATPFLERQVYQTQRKMIRVKWFTSCLNKQVYSLQLLAAINAIYVFKMVMKVIHASWDISGFDLQQSKPLLKIHIFFLLTTPRKKMANSQNNKLQNLIIITTRTPCTFACGITTILLPPPAKVEMEMCPWYRWRGAVTLKRKMVLLDTDACNSTSDQYQFFNFSLQLDLKMSEHHGTTRDIVKGGTFLDQKKQIKSMQTAVNVMHG